MLAARVEWISLTDVERVCDEIISFLYRISVFMPLVVIAERTAPAGLKQSNHV
jgi:hypothetical protein